MGLLNGVDGGNYHPDANGKVWESNNILDQYIGNPVRDWFNTTLANFGEWLKFNLIDIIKLIVVIVLIYTGLKIFVFNNKEKDYKVISFSIISYIVIKLFWRVILHA